jgi:hypothetical protein
VCEAEIISFHFAETGYFIISEKKGFLFNSACAHACLLQEVTFILEQTVPATSQAVHEKCSHHSPSVKVFQNRM